MNEFLREETTTGKLLLAATAVALVWANLAGDSYNAVWDTRVALGPEWLHLDLDPLIALALLRRRARAPV